jgi:hypothetical protein
MSGAMPPFPQYAFMAWCSVKAQGQLYLYLLPVQSNGEALILVLYLARLKVGKIEHCPSTSAGNTEPSSTSP